MNNVKHADFKAIAEAAELLKRGEVVAFPTETVYGLGANGFDNDAIQKIYGIKKRPPTNPLIFHVKDSQQARTLTSEWPEAAQKLADQFWPGPLTIILPVRSDFESVALAGGRTIALRSPAHPVARQLLSLVDFPIPAPSANISESLSPIEALHVWKNFGEDLKLILDGGRCDKGLESTVIRLTGSGCEILRPGSITAEQIKTCTGLSVIRKQQQDNASEKNQISPGLHHRHYAPKIPVYLVTDFEAADTQNDSFFITFSGTNNKESKTMINLGRGANFAARNLYHAFWKAQESGAKKIILELPPSGHDWAAIRDRISRAVQNPELLE